MADQHGHVGSWRRIDVAIWKSGATAACRSAVAHSDRLGRWVARVRARAGVRVTISVDQIATTYAQRRLAAGPGQAAMREVQRLVDGDLAVPLPELDKNERDMIPNRAAEGLKQMSMRIASSLPDVYFPPLRPGFKDSESRARDRRRANLGWWGANRMGLLLRQRARYLQGYARTPVQIRWDLGTEIPRWEVRNPLVTYPATMRGPQDLCPHDCIFETEQPLWWLKQNYPVPTMIVSKKENATTDTRFVVLEFTSTPRSACWCCSASATRTRRRRRGRWRSSWSVTRTGPNAVPSSRRSRSRCRRSAASSTTARGCTTPRRSWRRWPTSPPRRA
jgi:hypothetical protein